MRRVLFIRKFNHFDFIWIVINYSLVHHVGCGGCRSHIIASAGAISSIAGIISPSIASACAFACS